MDTLHPNIVISEGGQIAEAVVTTTAVEQAEPITTSTDAPVTTPDSTTIAETETKGEDAPVIEKEVTATETITEPKVEVKVTESEPKKLSKAELLKQYDLDEDELEELKKVKAEKNAPSKEDTMLVALQDFAVKNKKATVDEFVEYKNIKKVDSRTLVFDKFKSAQLAENSEMSDDDIMLEFEAEYNLKSDSPKQKEIGLKAIENEANEIRKPHLEKFATIENDFVISSNMGDYKKQQEVILNEFNKNKITKSVQVNGKQIEVSIDPNISMDELKKHFSTDEGKIQNNFLFSSFIENKTEAGNVLGQLLTNMASQKSQQEADQALADSVWQQAEQHFKDSSIGAKAPFIAQEESLKAIGVQKIDPLEQWKKMKGDNF